MSASRRPWPKRRRIESPGPDPAVKAWLRALHAAAQAFGVSPVVIAGAPFGPHGGKAARARDFAIYLLSVEGNFGLAAAGRIVGISKQGVQKVVRRVELMRDDPALDGRVSEAETIMRGAA